MRHERGRLQCIALRAVRHRLATPLARPYAPSRRLLLRATLATLALALLTSPAALAAQPTTTTLSLSTPTLTYGDEQVEVFSVVVSSASVTPTGKVSVKAGSSTLCTATLSGGKGSCSPKATKLKAGSYSVVASYAGTSQLAPSSSNPQSLSVAKASTSTSLSLSASPVLYGNEQTEIFTASVMAPGVTPTGSVPVRTDSTTLCTVKLSAGHGTCSPTATKLKAGSYPVIASYAGNSNLTASASSAKTLTVSAAARINLCGEIKSSETLSPESALVYAITCSVTVAKGATLSLAPGTIVKAEAFYGISVQGTLASNGTASNPATFTSINDNSVGGATGSGSPGVGDWGGIHVDSATSSVSLDHAVIDYASTGVTSSDAASTSITNSSVANSQSRGIEVQGGGDWTASKPAALTISGDSVTGSGDTPIFINDYNHGLALKFSALQNNSGSGNGRNYVDLINGQLTQSETWSFGAGALPVIVDGNLDVPEGDTLTVPAGGSLKFSTRIAGSAYMSVEGTLASNGTASNPATFTSINDNSVGGATGSGSPGVGDWGGIHVDDGGTVDLLGTTITFGSTALSVAEGAEAAVHGRIVNDTVGVSSNTYVDATEVDWGSPSGPAPIGTGTPIEGEGVQPTPWVGFVPPPKPPPSPPPYTPPSKPCANIVFIGARGSGEDGLEKLSEPYPTDEGTQEYDMGSRVRAIYQTVKREIAPQTIEPVAVEYPALGAGPMHLGSFANKTFFQNLWEGVSGVETALIGQESRCNETAKFILAGFSSGAFAVHQALGELGGSPTVSTKLIAGVALVADPAKLGNGGEFTVGSAANSADGLYTKIYSSDPGVQPYPIPQPLTSRTISLCNKGDFVCAPGLFSSTFYTHAYYTYSELESVGQWVAEQELKGN